MTEEPNQAQQELMFKLQMYEQHINQTQQQQQAVEQGVADLNDLLSGLEELRGKEGQEVMAQIGKGIFVKTKLISEELTVDIGNKSLVAKSIDDTKALIQEQLGKLGEARMELNKNLEKIQEEMTGLVQQFQESQGEPSEPEINEHVHGPDCNHD
tara:strand:- start:10657 stop:11121 length:465 start_codon:yes stop_codon:yes gene_type:complete